MNRLVACDNADHAGHKVYVGGKMDGQVDHIASESHIDRKPAIDSPAYPKSLGTLKVNGQRSWYLRDDEFRDDGRTAVYRCVGVGVAAPEVVRATYPTAPVPVAAGDE